MYKTSYAVLSEVKCLQSQFFVLDCWSTAAICKHVDSRSLAARELWHIGDADEVIVDDQEEEEEESDVGGDLDVVARERI